MSARRRSSTGAGGGGGASSAANSPAPPTRRLGLRARDSGAFDLGLLQNEAEEDTGAARGGRKSRASGGGVGGGGAPLFVLEDDEGQKVKPSHILGTIFVFALFSTLACLMFPGMGKVNDELSRTLAGEAGGVPFNRSSRATPQDLTNPAVWFQVEAHIAERLGTYQAEKGLLEEKYRNLTAIVDDLRKQHDLSGGGVLVGGADSLPGLEELRQLKAQLEAKLQQQQCSGDGVAGASAAEREQQLQEFRALKGGASQVLETVHQKIAELEATNAMVKEKIEVLDGKTAASLEGLGAQVQGLQQEEMRKMLTQAREAVDTLETKMEAARSEHAQLQDSKGLVDATKAAEEAERLTREVQETRAQLQEMVAQSKIQVHEVQRYMQELSTATAASQQQQEGAGDSPEATAALGVQLEQWKATIEAAVKATDALNAEKAAMDAKMEEARMLLEAATQKAGAGAALSDEDRATVHRLEEEMNVIRASQQDVVAAAARSEQMARTAQATYDQIRGEALNMEDVQAMLWQALKNQGGAKAEGAAAATPPSASTQEVLTDMVERTVRLYEADAVGMIDYAASATGGTVVDKLSSPTYSQPGQLFSTDWFHWWGYKTEIGPRQLAITPGHKKPGDCWPLQGTGGHLSVKLAEAIVPTSVTIDHIPREISKMPSTAPQHFRVMGRATQDPDEEPLQLHSEDFFTYDIGALRPVQTFALDGGEGKGMEMAVVTLEVLNNWGNLEYTCLYRFRVHGGKGKA